MIELTYLYIYIYIYMNIYIYIHTYLPIYQSIYLTIYLPRKWIKAVRSAADLICLSLSHIHICIYIYIYTGSIFRAPSITCGFSDIGNMVLYQLLSGFAGAKAPITWLGKLQPHGARQGSITWVCKSFKHMVVRVLRSHGFASPPM